MIVFPAVDIQQGKAVRLQKGQKGRVTVFSDNPVEMARKWQDEGAKWLHVIDLDGAFDGKGGNADVVGHICSAIDIPVQVGGGIRDIDAAARYVDAGATRLITGTVALENSALFAKMCARFPGRIGVSLDAANGRLKTRGWVEDANQNVIDVLPALEDASAAFIIYTDIDRDGMNTGLNLAALTTLLEATTLPVIAAGGVAGMDDVKKIASLHTWGNLEGMVTGRAIYEGRLNPGLAQKWLDDFLKQGTAHGNS